MSYPSSENGLVALHLEVTAETAASVHAFLQERGWEEADGLRRLLGAGLGSLRGEALLNPTEDDSAAPEGGEAEKRRLLMRLAECESQLANVSYLYWEMRESNTNWSLSSGAIERENIGLKAVTDRLREENALLLEQLRARTAQTGSSTAGSLRDRLNHFLRK